MKTLRDYIADTDMARLRQLAQQKQSAEKEVTRIRTAQANLREEQRSYQTYTAQRRVNAAAVALGEASPLPAYEGLSGTELQAMRDGLAQRLQDAEQELDRAKGVLRTHYFRTIDAAEAAAADQYVEAAQRTLEAWKAIALAQQLRVTAGVADGSIEPGLWVQNFRIAGSNRLEAVKKASRENMFGTFLAYGDLDAAQVFGESQSLLAALQVEVGHQLP